MAILETSDVGKRYGRRRWAIRHVDIAVPDGSITALVGPNGSGKSTLLKAWIGFERPSEGRVLRRRHRPVAEPRRRGLKRIGYVPQAPSLYRELTVDDHVRLAGTLRPGFDATLARRRLDDLDIPLDLPRRSSCPGASRRRSGWRSRWGRGRRSSSSTSRWRASTRWRGANSSTSWSRSVRADGATACSRRTSSPTSSRPATGCSSSPPAGRCSTCRSPAPSPSTGCSRPARNAGHGTVVGTFPGPDGERLDLVARRRRRRRPLGRAATLEEVVLGHLASARGDRPSMLPTPAAAA